MKTYELVTLPAQLERTDWRAVAVNCDLCSRTIKHLLGEGGERLNQEMVATFGNAFSVTVELKAGETNLDGGYGETVIFDVCPFCFSESSPTGSKKMGPSQEPNLGTVS